MLARKVAACEHSVGLRMVGTPVWISVLYQLYYSRNHLTERDLILVDPALVFDPTFYLACLVLIDQ
jgi:hypothetical protein